MNHNICIMCNKIICGFTKWLKHSDKNSITECNICGIDVGLVPFCSDKCMTKWEKEIYSKQVSIS